MIQAPVGHHCPNCVREANKDRPAAVQWTPGSGGTMSRLTPVVKWLIGINVAVFLLSSARPSIETRYAEWPRQIAAGQYERLITAAFLHANLLHIFFNMFALAIFGPPIEQALGRSRFVALYGLAAVGGTAGAYLFSSPDSLSVGASGAIFGLFGAYFVIARRRRLDTREIAGLIIANLVISFAIPNIDWRAHLGGLVTGGLVALVYMGTERLPESQRRVAEVAGLIALTAVLGFLVHYRTGQLHGVVA
jgi:membrane associated rhomboid family serine protease